ncbi:hydroxyisourate hydrolase [Microbulbifer harenosus]|uniref:5-hydroxyisourate hydrolase n=1 Tax=Microbulbifer harenosus TaxID=2576840 RepID=A0ABY2UM95_9GAMM|nr:hydroxyisourate hydrolase [Microbulbifer harenosus]TLM77010.1 hydroxyisourate hydrolase [Microbulbifer harenosus]
MHKAPITTHILDLHRGLPAAGVTVELHCAGLPLAIAETDSDGRIQQWGKDFELVPEHWSLVFQLQPWFEKYGGECFFPRATLEFMVIDRNRHHHVPLLLNQYGYTTYRGS